MVGGGGISTFQLFHALFYDSALVVGGLYIRVCLLRVAFMIVTGERGV